MSVQYLIDFENVHETGLGGLKDLPAEDNVYIFHTAVTDRIALSCLDGVVAWVKVILVPPGKQSLDMHLVSLLGYLIGKEDDPDTRYVIISKDSDYLGVSNFWNQSCSQCEKVTCAGSLRLSMKTTDQNHFPLLISDCTGEERAGIRKYIVSCFNRYGSIGLNGFPCMQVSELCARLNGLALYNEARGRTGKKPMQFLHEEFGDVILIAKQAGQDWVYLTDGQKVVAPYTIPSHDSNKSDLVETQQEEDGSDIMEMEIPSIDDLLDLNENSIEEPASDRGIKTEEAGAEADGVPEEKPGISEPETGTAAIKTTLPCDKDHSMDDVLLEDMNLSGRSYNSLRRAGYLVSGDFIHLSDQELLKVRNLGQKGVNEIRRWTEEHEPPLNQTPNQHEPEAEPELKSDETEPAHPDLLSSALDLIKSMDNSKDDAEKGRIRASVLRDMLLGYPDFRLALKNNGMKPIEMIQHLFEGKIRIFRDKGIYWASVAQDRCGEPSAEEEKTAGSERDGVIEKRKHSFYQQAHDSILTRLMNAGIDQALAEEIANIYMHSNTAAEPRKVIHTLLCQRFGNKLGSKYYRQTLKYF